MELPSIRRIVTGDSVRIGDRIETSTDRAGHIHRWRAVVGIRSRGARLVLRLQDGRTEVIARRGVTAVRRPAC